MSHQDMDRQQCIYNLEFLQRALDQLLSACDFKRLHLRNDCTWLPLQLAAAALFWAWSDELTLQDRFAAARRICQAMFLPQQQFAGSFQAFMKLLVRWTDALATALQKVLRRRMQEDLPEQWQRYGFVLLGIDGSRVELPRTKSHEAAYSLARDRQGRKVKRNRRLKPRTAAHSKKADTPHIWLTLAFHLGTGLPWAWRLGPTGSSERDHWRQMLPELPPGCLIAADAGFVGFDYLQAVIRSGRHFLVRVGSNVRLLRQLGYPRESQGTVYLWPDRVAAAFQPPLVLRLVVTAGKRHPWYLLTNVSAGRLSSRQVIEIYSYRWGVELFFRHLKQTFQRRKLRSTSAAHARVELIWSLLGLWSMAWQAEVQLSQQGIDPTRLSLAAVWRVYRQTMRDYEQLTKPWQWDHLICRAIRDCYVRRNKNSRSYPRKRHADPPAGAPKIALATPTQKHLAHVLKVLT